MRYTYSVMGDIYIECVVRRPMSKLLIQMKWRLPVTKCWFLVAFLALASCGGEPREQGASKCEQPENIALVDIQSVVDWINAMDKPLTLPCFIASLPRPLKTHSSISDFSAQPSVGRRSPRVFFFFDRLILTVAVDQDLEEGIPAEEEYHLLEMSFVVDEASLLTDKGELVFPVVAPLPDSAPYSQVLFGEVGSSCAFCHPNESSLRSIDGVPILQSSMLQPTVSLPIIELTTERAVCDPLAEPHRCDMLSSIIDHGALQRKDFPFSAKTIFDN